MRAVYFDQFGARPEIKDITPPTAPDGGVVINVEATGLCRSDWHAWIGHDDSVSLPHVPGHELVGTIAAVGQGVSKFRVGQRITVPFVSGCGTCEYCQSGNAQVCPYQTQPGFTHFGSYAEQVALHAADHNLVPVPADTPAEALVSLGCRFATSYRGLAHRAQVKPGETVAVFGCGGVGLSAVMIAVALGARVVAVDINPGALELAQKMGAEVLINSAGMDETSVAEAVITHARRPQVTLEALGLPVTMNAALLSLEPLGRHVQVGLFDGNPVTAVPRVIGQEIGFFGSHGMAAVDYPELVELVLEDKLRPQDLVTRTISLEETPEALMDMSQHTRPGMTIIRP